MRYNESFEKSAEYLRLALPMMSRQNAALHPFSYAVWYEFIAGINPALKYAMEEFTRDGKKLDEEATFQLYRKYVFELDPESAQKVSSGFQHILSEISKSAETAENHAAQYGNTLEKWVCDISKKPDVIEKIAGLDDILSDTRQMRNAIASLAKHLEDSRQEIEDLREEISKAHADALADALTGLANRKGFDLAMNECLSSNLAESRGPSIVSVDIDCFKKVNDNFGHLFGDVVLRSVAQILKQNVKGKDTAARYGGEEFVILLPDTSIQGAYCLADSIRTLVERCRVRHTDKQETIAKITVSLGVASYLPGESADNFLQRADEALFASKRNGRNRVTLAASRQSVAY